MDLAVSMACDCAESIQNTIDKRKSKGKKIHFDIKQTAHDCAQNALDEYGARLIDEYDGVPLYKGGNDASGTIEEIYSQRVYTECETLRKLRFD